LNLCGVTKEDSMSIRLQVGFDFCLQSPLLPRGAFLRVFFDFYWPLNCPKTFVLKQAASPICDNQIHHTYSRLRDKVSSLRSSCCPTVQTRQVSSLRTGEIGYEDGPGLPSELGSRLCHVCHTACSPVQSFPSLRKFRFLRGLAKRKATQESS